MKKGVQLLICFFAIAGLSAQNRFDQTWVLGYPPNIPAEFIGGTILNFQNDTLQKSFFNIEIPFAGTVAAISDKEGNLIAYTNGCQIENKAHLLMENGDSINPGVYHNQQCNQYSGYPGDQNALFLPQPGNDSIYYLFHLSKNVAGDIAWNFMYSRINARLNDGLGSVLEKNVFINRDSFIDMITATRHANGRDWWIIIAESYKGLNVPNNALGKYHRYLFDPYGIHYLGVQELGQLWTAENYIGQASFSPDGSQYVIVNFKNDVDLFDFDRCTGTLQNYRHIDLSQDAVLYSGVAFAPNSRFLYVTTGLKIIQFDTWAADVAAARTIVANYDGFQSPYPTTFFQLMLAPNGKIYGTAPNGVDILHVIHQPGSLGESCQVQQHGLKLPSAHNFTTPNFPHYRLYDVPGSICDSLGINAPIVGTETPNPTGRERMQIWPNPSNHQVNIQLPPESSGYITLMDVAGKTWITQTIAPGEENVTISTAQIPTGMYFLSFVADYGAVSVQKLLIQH